MYKIFFKIMLLLGFLGAVFVFYHFHFEQYFTLDYIKSRHSDFQHFYNQYPLYSTGTFFVIYVLITSLSLPGAALLTILAGSLFGVITGLIVVSFASSLGATLAFLGARLIFRDLVQKKFSQYIDMINDGIKKDGAFYLFTLRLIPAIPFFVINLVMGLTQMRVRVFYGVSQIGMLLGTLVYVNAGARLSEIHSLSDIMSIKLISSLVLLGILPHLSKKLVAIYRLRKLYRPYQKPKNFDYNMVVIGAGSAGLVTAYISAVLKAKVALIEKNKMGGDCLNTGCVPSKAIIKSAKICHLIKNAHKYGLKGVTPAMNFSEVMKRVHAIINKVEPHDSVERYTNLGVECIGGEASLISPWEVKVGDKILTTKAITLAGGAKPFIPDILGLEQITPLTSDNIWNLTKLPQRLVILGGGPIGCEMAQAFARLGSQVTQIEKNDSLLSISDCEIGKFLKDKFKSEGINVLTNYQVMEIKLLQLKKYVVLKGESDHCEIEFDELLIAVGRKPRVDELLGSNNLGIVIRDNQTIEANQFMQTNYPNIFVCGDLTGPYQLTHTASYQAWFCAVNGLLGKIKKFKIDYKIIPWTVYTDPEVASVGYNEKRAQKENIPYELTVYPINDLDRAIADSEDHGFVRVLTKPGSDEILGVTIVSNHASDMLAEFVLAMKYKLGLNKILNTIHTYPSMNEASKYVAGEWKKKQVSPKILSCLKKWHEWSR